MIKITLFIQMLLISTLLLPQQKAHCQKLISVVQKGHSAVVKSADFSNSGKYVVTASRDKTVKLWERKGGLELRTFYGHELTINQVIFSSSDKYIATSSADNSAKVWDVETGKELFSTKNNRYNTALAFSPDDQLLAVGGTFDEVIIWNWKKKEVVKRLSVSPDRGLSFGVKLSFSETGERLFIGEDNQNARIFNTKTWKEEVSFPLESGYCGGCVAFGAFGKDDTFYKLDRKLLTQYDLKTGQKNYSITHELKDVQSMSYVASLKSILIATEDLVMLLNPISKDTLLYIPAVETRFNEATANSQGTEVVISTENNRAIIYNISEAKELLKLEGVLNFRDKGGIQYDPNNYWSQHIAKYVQLKNPMVISKDQKYLLKGRYGKNIRSIELNSGRPIAELALHTKAVLSMDLSSDGKRMVAGDGAGGIFLWDLITKDTIRSYGNLQSPVFEVRFSENEESILSTSWDGNVVVWDTETGAIKSQLFFEKFAAYTATFTPNDLYIITAGLNNTLEMYEIDSKEKVRVFSGHTKPINQISFNNSGEMLSCGWDGSIRLWNVATGLMTQKWQTNQALYTAIFSPDQRYIVAAGADRIIKFFDVSTGKLEKEFMGHQASIVGLQFLEGGNKLVSLDLDGTMKFWDLEKDKEIYEHIQISKNEWMVRTPEGYFMGTDAARSQVHFVEGMKSFTTDQFFDTYYRPELMQQLFNTDSGEESKGIKGKLKSSPPPEITIEGSKSSDDKRAYLMVKAINTGGGIFDLRLYHNKKRLMEVGRRALIENKDTIVYQYKLPLLAGENIFEVSARSKKGIASKMQQLKLVSTYGSVPPKCHIFIVGINEYNNQLLKLNYARPDAEAVSKLLGEKQQMPYEELRIHAIYDKDASKKAILDTLDKLSEEIELQDVFMFYYAGHGSMVEEEFYFVPTDMSRLYDKKSLDQNGLSAHELQEKFQNIKALKQVVIMDACQSGASVDVLAKRGLLKEKAMAQLSRSSGVHILAAAGSEQFAIEYEHLGHGLFTYILLEGLAGKADGAPKDGKVTVFELKSYLDDQVPAYSQKFSGQAQYPYTFSKGNDFPIIINDMLTD